jgi:nucleoside-diphosphate-sugar epimerase
MKSPGKKTLLITGATGFIGSNLINEMSESEYEIIGVKRNCESTPRLAITRKVRWVTSPLEEISSDVLCSADVIVHLASHTANHPYDTLYNCIDQNVVRHLKFIENAFKAGVNRFVLAGSCFEYGTSGEKYDYIPVNAPLEPKGSYPVSKAMFFFAVKEFFMGKQANVSYQRIFQVYGEGEAETRFWPTLRSKAFSGEDMLMTKGEQLRDFINVTEVASKLKSKVQTMLGSEKCCFDIENLASGNPQSLKEFAQYWWKEWSAKGQIKFGAIPYRHNEVMRFIPEVQVEDE